MAYVSDSNLTQFWGLAKDYIKAENSRYANWQQTEKAGAVTCWPVGGTPLLPTVDFLFTETGPAEGTKGPDNPSTITGVSTITVTRCETVGVDSTDYAIGLNGTYYGGSVDVSAGTMTVTHDTVELNGDSPLSSVGFSEKTNCYILGCYPPNKGTWTAAQGVFGFASDKFTITQSSPTNGNYIQLVNGSIVVYVSFNKSDLGVGDGQDLNTVRLAALSWLGNNPVQFVYPVLTPYTVTLTPTQIYSLSQLDPYTPRLNTVYTDAQAVQVGYVKSPIRSEYELTQAIIATEGGE